MKRKDGNGSLSKTNVTAEDAILYICTATHLTNNLTEQIKVTVTCEYILNHFQQACLFIRGSVHGTTLVLNYLFMVFI